MYYRKYRPQTIDELDNVAAREIFGKIFHDKNNFPHAFLLTGPKGIGKTSTARIIAKLINCTSEKKVKPCNECDSCISITNGNNVDVMEMDAASNRGIEEIRELKDKIRLSPSLLKYKVYIIDEVHMLTTEAFNALLKTLEEPPEHAVFILCTTNPEKIPETISSRCIRFDFKKASAEELKRSLERVVRGEEIELENETLKTIINKADGSFRDAVKTLEQLVSVIGQKINNIDAQKLIQGNTQFDADKFIDLLLTKNVEMIFPMLQDFSDKGGEPKDLLVEVLQKLQIILKDNLLKGETSENTIALIRLLDEAYGQIRGAAVPMLPIEIAVIEWCGIETKPAILQTKTKPLTLPVKKEETITPPVNEIDNSEAVFSLEQLQSKWQEILTELKKHNHSIQAFMRSARPERVNSNTVIIEVFYPFHKQKLEEQKCLSVVEEVIGNIMSSRVVVKYVLGNKMDKEDIVKAAEEIFTE